VYANTVLLGILAGLFYVDSDLMHEEIRMILSGLSEDRLQKNLDASDEGYEQSKKLLKLTVEVGAETRTVVSGIKQWYTPDDLVGKTVVLVANLKPVTLCGVESHGMILCASDATDENLSALTTLAEMESGLKVR